MCIWEWGVSCFNRFEQCRFYTNEDSCTSYIRHAFCWGYNFYNYFWTALYLQTCILIGWGCLWVNLSRKGNLTRYALASCAEAKMRKLLMYWHIHNKIFFNQGYVEYFEDIFRYIVLVCPPNGTSTVPQTFYFGSPLTGLCGMALWFKCATMGSLLRFVIPEVIARITLKINFRVISTDHNTNRAQWKFCILVSNLVHTSSCLGYMSAS